MTTRLSMRPRAQKKVLISVIIPVEPDGDASAVLNALKGIDWPSSDLEVLLARGRQPSRQRNMAAKAAHGQWLLFLDSDSKPESGLIQRLLAGAGRLGADVAGGPNLAPENESFAGLAFSAVLASYFGSMSARARYRSVGKTRLSTEKEMILCNMLVRRSQFVKLGGFREDLYPNEENEFLNRLQNAGGRLAYVPDAIVRRSRRQAVGAFAKQAFSYGRGRMRQMRVNFFVGDLIHLLPLLALVYALALPMLVRRWPIAAAPVYIYALTDVLACLVIASRPSGAVLAGPALLLFPLRHFSYGLGLAFGLFGLNRRAGKQKSRESITIKKWR